MRREGTETLPKMTVGGDLLDKVLECGSGRYRLVHFEVAGIAWPGHLLLIRDQRLFGGFHNRVF